MKINCLYDNKQFVKDSFVRWNAIYAASVGS